MIDSIEAKYKESFLKYKVKGYEDCPKDDIVAKAMLAAQIDFNSEAIAREFISFCVEREYEDRVYRFQDMLIDEYREHNPQFADFSNEQLRLMCPVSPDEMYILKYDILNEFLLYLSDDIKELTDSIAWTQKKLDDPTTFSNELSEYRNDLHNDERILFKRRAEERQIKEELVRLNDRDVLR